MAGYNQGIHAQLTLADFVTVDKPIVAGEWNKLGYKQVGITEEIGLGYGGETGFDDAQGRVYALMKDTDGITLQGELKFVIEDTQGNTIEALPFNMTLDYLGNGASNLRDRVEYSFQNLIITRERQIALYIKPKSVGPNDTFDVSTSKFAMSITRVSL
jgi:hypothetical protein